MRRSTCLLLLAGACVSLAGWSLIADEDNGDAQAARRADDFRAGRLFRKAEELMSLGEDDRGIKMLQTILEQHSESLFAREAQLALGKHFLKLQNYPQAVQYLKRLKDLRQPNTVLKGRPLEIYLEGQYLLGVAHFETKNYASAFPVLRRITKDHPNTVWANQAYYYVGLCHFAQSNWTKAIDALSLVGTFVDPDSPSVEYVEAGRRFYVKIEDADLPVLHRLGRTTRVEMETQRGDRETVTAVPLSMQQGMFIASIPTEIGAAEGRDDRLQVIGGDAITVKYYDDNTKTGQKDMLRQKTVQVVSTGSVQFTTGTYESDATAAFLGQPLFVLLHDADLDTTAQADQAAVRIFSRYRVEDEDAETDLRADLSFEEKQTYRIRDEVVVSLKELGEGAVHTGRFGGQAAVRAIRADAPADKTDDVLSCVIGDEVLAVYVDALHMGGLTPRQVETKTTVAGGIDARPRATQNVVTEPELRAKKLLVEAAAYLELARIFRSMGLLDGASTKAVEGLDRCKGVQSIREPISAHLREESFQLKWDLHMVMDDFPAAIATCKVFQQLYPNSPFVDQAMLGIGRTRFESKRYSEAVGVFSEILKMENSQAKAEAQFMIAQCTELANADDPAKAEAAIRAYKLCAERYSDSPFAGPSLAKLVDYHVKNKDHTRADDLLEQIFQDYPDADFLDEMLWKWTFVTYASKDYAKAYEKCTQLIFEYPQSRYAATARKYLKAIKEKAKGVDSND